MEALHGCIPAVFTRIPVPGATKTRLQARISPEECAALHKAFLLDMLERISPVCTDMVLCYSDEWLLTDDAEATLCAFLTEVRAACDSACHLHLLAQEGDNLGKRMLHAVDALFDCGASACMLLGSDLPDITADDIERARDVLETHDVVFGPGEDGGYWLVGLHQPVHGLFEGQRFSTETVLENALATCRKLNKRTGQCRCALDVDEPSDLDRLIAGNVNVGPRTARVLARL